MDELKFKWSNYFKPTPKNLRYFTSSIKSIVLGLAGGSYLAGNSDLSLAIGFVGLVLDELLKFFGNVEAEESKRVISVAVPTNADVEVKDEIKNDTTSTGIN